MSSFPEASGSEMCITDFHKKIPLIWEQHYHSGSFKPVHVATLRGARVRGCETCSLLCEALARFKGIPIDQLTTGVVVIEGFKIRWGIDQPKLPLEQVHDQFGVFEQIVYDHFDWIYTVSEGVVLDLFTITDVPCNSSWNSTSRNPHGDRYYPISCITLPGATDSDETLIQVHKWLEDCTNTHNRCGPGTASRLPTRILDLGGIDETNTVKIVEAQTILARYACLSHCWGGKVVEAAMATTKSLGSMKKGIPIGTLPQSFRDAVHITRRLGLQYLWIDSMCILQDDASDWDRESRKMASIYQGAFITIGATCASDASKGFLRSSNPACSMSLGPLKYRTADGQPPDIYVRQKLPHFTGSDLSAHPLLGRAWIDQERLLSPRFLHFAQDELIWECNEQVWCQCSLLLNKPSLDSTLYWDPSAKHTYSKAICSGRTQDLASCWENVVGHYNQLALSFEKDRFRAIAGIADQISTAGVNLSQGEPSLGRYIEGLWEKSILENLCWSRLCRGPDVRKFESQTRWKEWRAPTWSWASVQHPSSKINFEYPAGEISERFAEVLEFGYTNHPLACQEYVQYNFIRLKLRTACEITLDRESYDCYGQNWLSIAGMKVPMLMSPDYSWYNAAGEDQVRLGSKVICGLLLTTAPGRSVGLLMVPVDEEHDLYRRIGIFHIQTHRWPRLGLVEKAIEEMIKEMGEKMERRKKRVEEMEEMMKRMEKMEDMEELGRFKEILEGMNEEDNEKVKVMMERLEEEREENGEMKEMVEMVVSLV